MKEKNIHFLRSLKIKQYFWNCVIRANTNLLGDSTRPPGHASELLSVTGHTEVVTDEKHCDLVLWACGVTEGCLTRKARERQWKFMTNTK